MEQHALQRRSILLAGCLGLTGSVPAIGAEAADAGVDATARALRRGGVVAIFRHAEAPGVYDPPNLVLGDCSTQRNLDESGRAQALRMGPWFASRQLQPRRVLSSPWCRCLETARLGFGQAEAWAALGSPAGVGSEARRVQLQTLQDALRAVPAGQFEVWVTHNFVIADLAGVSTASAEGLVIQAGSSVQVVGRLPPA